MKRAIISLFFMFNLSGFALAQDGMYLDLGSLQLEEGGRAGFFQMPYSQRNETASKVLLRMERGCALSAVAVASNGANFMPRRGETKAYGAYSVEYSFELTNRLGEGRVIDGVWVQLGRDRRFITDVCPVHVLVELQ